MSQASDFLTLSGSELARAFESGHPFDPSALADAEYKGTSLGMPRFVEKLTWKKFKKVFHRDPDTKSLRGWNVRLEQNPLAEACVPKTKNGAPMTFGHYLVVEPGERRMPVPGRPAVLLDYGAGENAWWDPMRFVRDPLVAVNEGDVSLLLGCMYIEVGPLRIRTPSFFTLEHDGPLTQPVRPPGRR